LTDQLAFLKLDKLRVAGDAGVVDEDIDAPVFSHHVINPGLHFLPVDHIHFIKTRAFAEFFHERVAGFFIHITDNDFRAFLSELERGGFSDACGAASYDTNSILQTHADLL